MSQTIEFTEDEKSMLIDAIVFSSERWRKSINDKRRLVLDPPRERSPETRETDKRILERFYELYSALENAKYKVERS